MKPNTKDINLDLFAVAPGVWGMKDIFVNVFAVQNPSDDTWVLIDAGIKWSAPKIKKMAAILFKDGSKPSAIILTHGHFDHVGSVAKLAKEWDIPVYAHHLEMPYLTGVSSYPPPDPTVGGGLLADLAFLYPKSPINIEDRVIALPPEGRIPGLSEWKYIHTPGHAPGHISLFRESDKVLLAGDAVVTTRQESVLAVIFQTKRLSGPPKYFTYDWLSAAWSVEHLAKLEPEVVATGHGRPMRGERMRKSLHNLARNFDRLAVPSQGRYVHQPALTDDSGVVQVPPKNKNATASPLLKLLGVAAAILIGRMLLKKNKKKNDIKKPRTVDFESLKYPVYQETVKPGNTKTKRAVVAEPVKQELSKIKEPVKKELARLKEPVKKELAKLKEPLKNESRKLKKSVEKQRDRLLK